MAGHKDENIVCIQGDVNKIFEASKIPFIITDNFQKDNPIIIANSAFLDLTGYDSREVIGHNCRFMQGFYTSKAVVQAIRRNIANNSSINCVILNYTKKRQPFWNALFIAPLKNEKGEDQYFIASQVDVTKIMGCQQSLNLIHESNRDATNEILNFAYEKYAASSEFKKAEEQCVVNHFSDIFEFLDLQKITRYNSVPQIEKFEGFKL